MVKLHKINKDKTSKNKILTKFKFKPKIKLSLLCYPICKNYRKIYFCKGPKETSSLHRNI